MSLRISVITVSLNSAEYIEDAIMSVLEQGYDDLEHIVVDGASTDRTVEILKHYPHLQWISEPDTGPAQAMNKGFRMSTGDIIVYLNSDDYFLPGAFRAVIPFFKNGAKVVVGKIKIEREVGLSFVNNPRVKHEEMLRHWEHNAFPFNPLGYFYLREVQESVGGFNENSDDLYDLDFLLAASSVCEFTKLNRLLGVFRNYENTINQLKQRDPEYWTFDNFGIIDKYLEKYSPEFVKGFNEDRKIGYARKRRLQLRREKKLARRNQSPWKVCCSFFAHPKEGGMRVGE